MCIISLLSIPIPSDSEPTRIAPLVMLVDGCPAFKDTANIKPDIMNRVQSISYAFSYNSVRNTEIGSTEYIIDVINDSEPGSKWGVGTEINLVKRLASQNPDKEIFCLDPIVCPCATMYRIHPAYLLWVLDGIAAGLVINQVEVENEKKINSKIALDRMLNLPK